MKKASKFLKQIFSALVVVVRERSMAVRTKTSVLRTRLIFLGILRNKKLLMSAINSRIHASMRASEGGSGRDGRRGDSAHGNGQQHLPAGGGGGGRMATALLQTLPSFAMDQEKKAVVLLNSLPSFAMGQDGGEQLYDDSLLRSPLVCGGGDVEEEDGRQQLQLTSAPAPGSVIELARRASERGGVDFRLEDEIDHVADVFIRRFHDQMKLQKLESFKRFCEKLERN